MRCPKCGFISFDHVDTCLKCKKDISAQVDVEGTTFHAAAPSFLKVRKKDPSEEKKTEELSSESGEIEFQESPDFRDPDLDVLVDGGDDSSFTDNGYEDEVESGPSFAGFDKEDVEADFQLEADEDIDDDDFVFDLEDEEMDAPGMQTATAGLNVPEELSDISDLAPPEIGGKSAEAELDEGLDLDLGLGNADGELSLSLDDIDIGDELSDEDADLDGLSMDLDLGGLGGEASKDKEKKSINGLDDISLSLD